MSTANDHNLRYSDPEYEYRHVQLPKQMLKAIPKDYFDGSRGTLKLLWEEEWRALGITQVHICVARL
jgi:cyclin-dependent kinase regulatory subunit CKS1